jgi:hypothetical protein
MITIVYHYPGTEMVTHKKPASDSSKVLRNRNSSRVQKEIAGSDLSQAPRHKTSPPKPKKRG